MNSDQLEIFESLPFKKKKKKRGKVVLFESDAKRFSWASNNLLSSQWQSFEPLIHRQNLFSTTLT